LKFIHDTGVIHRDIKPANIMRRSGDGKVILIDFGVAKQATGALLVGKGTMIGTLGYAPAEQLQSGEAYPASDLYALGATCIHLLTGTHPFNLYNALEARLMWREHLPTGIRVSSQLAEILDKLVQHLVKDRYQSADDVLHDLNPTAVHLSPQGASLASEKGIDYSRLRDLLAAGNWKEANEETRQKMLEVMGQQQRDYLDNEDIQRFPCTDLRTINELWVYYSSDRFGFSVQKRIWKDEGGRPGVYNLAVYEKFGERVGWRENDNWKLYCELTFSSDSVLGHLPLGMSIGWGTGAIEFVGVEGAVEVDCLFSRLEDCEL
jgi:serine/threonine protein kinase